METVKLVVALIFFVIGFAVALILLPGLDILAWHLLRPAGFWQGISLVGLEVITAAPRFVGGILFIAIGADIAHEIL